jgi:hypothetical protein
MEVWVALLLILTFLIRKTADTAILTWKPEIVSAFRQPDLTLEPQDFLSDNFDKQIEYVETLFVKISSMERSRAEQEMHRVFVDSLVYQSKTGIYSNMHSVSVFERGYTDKETVRLAFM